MSLPPASPVSNYQMQRTAVSFFSEILKSDCYGYSMHIAWWGNDYQIHHPVLGLAVAVVNLIYIFHRCYICTHLISQGIKWHTVENNSSSNSAQVFLCLFPETNTLNSVSASSLRHKTENSPNRDYHHPLQHAVSQANTYCNTFSRKHCQIIPNQGRKETVSLLQAPETLPDTSYSSLV